ncbi:HpcH/HpaI aldolase family protein [Rhodococcus qingshengii]|uniref:HpcH/HpaI aldolase family protein n=1 Tax=Rhodococcus qingshengii TaxID=334542 RepID=UPI00071C7F3F|nr:aldolase/citrate lyase family protein [Rhodococcus qingshengii]KSU70912.1 4-hydroxy-2-oxovalerate aldolase [Rhodococcus qingshengii]SCC63089.1 4-hydroxy-2-oxoheptanedioate aldolase [Rhodococcus qingshengii]
MSPGTLADQRLAFWLTSPHAATAEIAYAAGFRAVLLDIEHGTYDLASLERLIPVLKGLGMDVLAKVLAPERAPIQQALDFGADAVVIPHVENLAHAKAVTAFAKFPTLGDRSFAGGRTHNYIDPLDDAWAERQDQSTRCYPMIEDSGALDDIESILSLPTVDGVFVGPTDLSIRRGRGTYKRTEADYQDIEKIARAARAAGKHWVFPSWTLEEQRFGVAHGANQLVVSMEQGALYKGFAQDLAASRGVTDAESSHSV